MEYTVYAYSPSLNQEVRLFQLEKLQNVPFTSSLAGQHADAFAERLTSQQHLKATDWQGRVKQEELGIHTLPGYLSLS